MKVATFKCNQHRKPAKSWRADKPPGGLHPAPPQHGTQQRRAASAALARADGTRKEIIKYQRLQKGASSGSADILTHMLAWAKGFPNQEQLFRKLEEYSQKSKYGNASQKKKEGRRILAVGNI